jgi:hypothetical protein
MSHRKLSQIGLSCCIDHHHRLVLLPVIRKNGKNSWEYLLLRLARSHFMSNLLEAISTVGLLAAKTTGQVG